MAITQHLPIPIGEDEHGVLIFHTWRNKIPEGIQVLPVCGEGSSPKVSSADDENNSKVFKNLRIGYDSFIELCSIVVVNVSEGQNGYCRVYVNFERNLGQPGRDAWWTEGNPYKMFLRSLFNESYANVKVRVEGKKTSLRFSDKRPKQPVEAKIIFVPAEQLATAP